MPLLMLQLPALTTLVIDRCFARDLMPLAHASRLDSLHLSYDCWAIMGVTFPHTMPALKKLRLMAALQVRARLSACCYSSSSAFAMCHCGRPSWALPSRHLVSCSARSDLPLLLLCPRPSIKPQPRTPIAGSRDT
jgi:hypothetical protein